MRRTPHRTLQGIASVLALAGVIAACAPVPAMPPASVPGGMAGAPAEIQPGTVLQITPQRPEDMDELARLGMDIYSVEHGRIEGRANAAALAYANERGLAIQPLPANDGNRFDDLPSFLQLMTKYHSADAIAARLQAIEKQHPHLATVYDLGPSWQTSQGKGHRRIWALRLTAGTGGDKPKVLFTAGMHARELAPPEITMRLIEDLIGNYGKDERITRILATREAWFVPMLNPDGRAEVEQGQIIWRKNHRVFDFTQAIGVDLNRNFDSYWDLGSDEPESDTYRGQAPFSEPETQAIRDLYVRERFALSMDYHAYGNMVLWPPGWSREVTQDEATFAKIGRELTKDNGYSADTVARTLYIAPASIMDWAYQTLNAFAFCTEMGHTFWPESTELPKLYAQNRDGALHLLEIAGNPKGTPTISSH